MLLIQSQFSLMDLFISGDLGFRKGKFTGNKLIMYTAGKYFSLDSHSKSIKFAVLRRPLPEVSTFHIKSFNQLGLFLERPVNLWRKQNTFRQITSRKPTSAPS